MEQLREAILAAFPEKKIVFGDGTRDARVVLIGEAPGEQEEKQGRPFVGKAGKNLDAFLRMTGLARENLYITNVVKFRPTKLSKAGNIVNRPPTKEEIAAFLPFLRQEIALIAPKTIVTLGNVALKALCGEDVNIGDAHGRMLANVYPLYHPAAVIYNPALKEVYKEDVLRLGEMLSCQEL